MAAYDVLKFVHVLLAVTALGANITYGVWLTRAAREPQHLDHILRGITWLDSRMANPAYILLFVTGAGLVFAGHVSWQASWLLTAVALYAVVAALGIVGYAPVLRAQAAALRRDGPAAASYRALDARARRLGLVIVALVVAIVFLMVTKPALW